MKGLDKYVYGSASGVKGAGLVIAPAGVAAADQNMVQVDLSTLDLDREFLLGGRMTPNATAVGASASLAINWYWSDFLISTPATNVPLLCPTRKFTTGPIALPNANLAANGERYFAFRRARILPILTVTASTTTATITFPQYFIPNLQVGDLITIAGGTVGGNGNFMQGTYPVASVTNTSGVYTVTYTITSSTGTLVGPTVYAERTLRSGFDDIPGEVIRPMARYLYFSTDNSAWTNGATIELVLALFRVPGREIRL